MVSGLGKNSTFPDLPLHIGCCESSSGIILPGGSLCFSSAAGGKSFFIFGECDGNERLWIWGKHCTTKN